MIQLSSLLWVAAIFFAIIGFMRGWNQEVLALAGVVLGFFFLFQFDSVFRGILLSNLSREQAFMVQSGLFIAIVFVAYRMPAARSRPGDSRLQTGILGGIVGFVNGYLISGTLWYFLDINEYPLSPLVIAPAANSPSVQTLNSMPILLLGGGVGTSGDVLAVIVLVLFLLVLFVI